MDNASLSTSRSQELRRNFPLVPYLISHRFIREYYGISGGSEHKIVEFWKPEKFPEEIKVKLENGEFSLLWSQIWNHDVRHIICNATKAYQDWAWKLLLTQSPTMDDFCLIISHTDNEYADLAWDKLMKEKFTNDELYYLLIHGFNRYVEKAWLLLDSREVTGYDMCYLIALAPPKYKELAWLKLEQIGFTEKDLSYLTNVVLVPKSYKKRARKVLKEMQEYGQIESEKN